MPTLHVLLASALVPTAVGQASPHTAVPPPVEVSIVAKKPLRLVTWDHGEGTTAAGLDGVLVVEVRNRGTTPVALRNLGVHGLRWVNAVTGDPFVVVHPCECALLLGEVPPGATIGEVVRVEPGATALVTLEDFACDAPWTPPPEGDWDLTFRVLPAEAPVGPHPGDRPDLPHLREQCRTRLLAEAFWAGSFASPPLAVTLGAPKRVKVTP